MKYISNHHKTNILKHYSKVISSATYKNSSARDWKLYQFRRGSAPLICFHSNQSLFVQNEIMNEKVNNALDAIINDGINSRKSNTFNAFALPISEGKVPPKKFKPVIYRHDAILVCKK